MRRTISRSTTRTRRCCRDRRRAASRRRSPASAGLLNPTTFDERADLPDCANRHDRFDHEPCARIDADLRHTAVSVESTGVGVTSYQLSVGTFEGGSDVYFGPAVTTTSGARDRAADTRRRDLGAAVLEHRRRLAVRRHAATPRPAFRCSIDLAPTNVVSVEGNEAQTTPPFNACRRRSAPRLRRLVRALRLRVRR